VLAIVWALASAIGYGASDYAAGLATRAASVIRVTLLAEAASVLALLLVAPWASTQTPSAASVAWAAVAGLGGIIGAMTLYLGFRHAAFSVAVSASRGGEPEGGDSGSRAAGTAYGLVAGVCFAVLFIGLNRSGSGHDLWPLVIAQVTGLIAVSLIAAVSRDLKPPPLRAGWLAILAGVTGAAGTTCYFVATHESLLAVTAVITSLYPGSTILLARVLLGERLTRTRLAGLGLAAASVALIAVGGSG
jgi:drug/metabolite transporter (DMT)-like permease